MSKNIINILKKIDKIALKGKDSFLEYYTLVDDLSKSGDYDNLLQCLYTHYEIDINKLPTVDSVKKNTWNKILLMTQSLMSKRIKKLYDSKQVYQTGYDIWSSDPNFISIDLSNPLTATYSAATASAGITITRSNNTLNLNITNNNIYDIALYKTTWTNGQPSDLNKFQVITGITQSTYKLEIPTTQDTEWLISTKERPNYKVLNYSLSVSTNKYLGQIIEDGIYTDETKYYIKNREYARITKTRKTFLEVIKVGATQSVFITDDNLKLSEDNNLYNRYVKAVNLLLL
jgi:hypothetical protein